MSQPQSTKTGWSGKDYRFRPDKDKILRAWRDGTMRQLLFRDMSFRKVPYTGRPVYLVDGAGTAYGFRADVSSWMFKPEAVWDGRNFLEQIAFESLRYRDECGDRSQKDIDANHRGDHWYNVIGVDRQIKQSPKLTVFHTLHMAQTDKLLWDKGATRRLIAFAADILRTRFPCLAERVERCAAKLLEQGWDYAIPMFECWYNYCINAPRPGSQLGVCTEPHVDGKNLALMVCAVFVWGNFDSKEKAWLVLWEAGLVIELPVGVLILYPSSLFLHFNVNMSALPIVTTADGQLPTPQNSTPLESVVGRGSIVLFNQASMFQLAELGCSVKEAQQAKMASTCDNAVHVARLPVP
ncbi:hypothetical protein L226DRAFT_224805 [Lentinus tigrinus ALCF2SS1-7]|nr:hypothetical protein L226DRAFT_224805 [Lentinus tigrinus ALCF2SS1-7]